MLTIRHRIALIAVPIVFALCLAPAGAWAAESINGQTLTLSKTQFVYNGKTPTLKAKAIGGKTLVEGTDYRLQFSTKSPVSAGTYTVQAIGKGAYTGKSKKATFKILKAKNTMKVKAKKSRITLRYTLVKKANQTIKRSGAFSITKAKGKLTFKKKSGNAKVVVSKAGTVTVKRGLKAGTYTVKVWVKAAGDANHKPLTKVVTLKIRLRGDIKGNISYSTGEKIYHLPGDRYYKSTVIDESEGERWFVTEQQARNAGWRHSYV